MDLIVVAGYFGCAFFGILFGIFIMKRKPDGVLKVDVSDPARDRYLMEFHIPLDEIPSKKHVYLTVVNTVENP